MSHISVVREAPMVPSGPEADGDHGGTFTYIQLWQQGIQATAALTRLGVGPGDRVAALLPMGLESVVTTLACVRLEAIRITLPLAGDPVADWRRRIRETEASVVITADGCELEGTQVPLKTRLDRALTGCPDVRGVLVVQHVSGPVSWTPGRDQWWQDALASEVA